MPHDNVRQNEQVDGGCSDNTDNHTGWMGRPDWQSISGEHLTLFICVLMALGFIVAATFGIWHYYRDEGMLFRKILD